LGIFKEKNPLEIVSKDKVVERMIDVGRENLEGFILHSYLKA